METIKTTAVFKALRYMHHLTLSHDGQQGVPTCVYEYLKSITFFFVYKNA